MSAYDSAAFLLRQIQDLPDNVLRGDWIDFPTITCERRWSDGEWCLIIAAQDLYNGMGRCTLGQAIANLDARNFAALVRSLELRRPECFETNLAPMAGFRA